MNRLSDRKRLLALVLTAIFAVFAPSPTTAQTAGTGTIAGTVTDASGAIVPGANVVITNTDTGAARTVTTNSSGEYTSTFLQPGRYEVVVTGEGFGKVNRQNLVLTVGQVLTVDVALSAGSTATEVTVTDVSPLIDTLKTQVSQTVSASRWSQTSPSTAAATTTSFFSQPT